MSSLKKIVEEAETKLKARELQIEKMVSDLTKKHAS